MYTLSMLFTMISCFEGKFDLLLVVCYVLAQAIPHVLVSENFEMDKTQIKAYLEVKSDNVGHHVGFGMRQLSRDPLIRQ